MFSKYGHLIRDYVVDPESYGILQDFAAYFAEFQTRDDIDWPEFFAWTRVSRKATLSPDGQRSYESAVTNVSAQPVPSESIVERFVELDFASRIGGAVDGVLEGTNKKGMEEVAKLITEYSKAASIHTKELVTDDLSNLLDVTVRPGGIEWRLEDLNRAVGPLRKGDFILIGKRPEVGGTSFVCSEITHMVTQLPPDQDVVIFNNEEVGAKIGLRLYEAGLGATAHDLSTNGAALAGKYKSMLGGRRIDVIDKPGMSTGFVEQVLRSRSYGIVVFNTLAKIAGFGKLEGVARMEALGQWARGLAAQHGVVFAVHQADNTAEGVEYLNQDQLYGSKTGLQGETDVQIMIGKSPNPAKLDKRYISVVRNKMPGGPRTDPTMKYARFECAFDWQTGRFTSLSFP
jgi:hypothetical protein